MSRPYLATCSYREMKSEYGVPVRISLGRPKFSVSYPLNQAAMALAPKASYFNADDEVFEYEYRKQLNRHGEAGIGEALAKIAANTGSGTEDRPLVLLCFEDLSKGMPCHRRDFAAWWLKTTGQVVPELGAQ